jgi:hypothetical protein
MVSLNFKLAVLSVLAQWPERRLTLDEVRCEIEIIVNEDQGEQLKRFAALGDIDIFQSGLVSRDEQGFQITDAGLSLLHSLESSSEFSPEVSSAPASQQFRLIDGLIGTEERLKIFDLELRTLEEGFGDVSDHRSEQEEENGSVPIGTPDVTSETRAVDLPEMIDSQIPEGGDDGSNHNQSSPDEKNRTGAIEPPDAAPLDAPAFLRRSFGSNIQEPGRKLPQLFAFIATKKRFVFDRWRRHFAQGVTNPRTERIVGGVGGAAFAVLSLLVVVTCVGAAIALGQIKSLKSDIALLHRELLPLRERLGRLEQAERTKKDSDQQEEAQNKSDTEKNKEIRTDQSALNLSREEIQLIREYIKPAPVAGAAAPATNVGDPVEGGMIPLPSQLTDKVPKLVGGKFSIRNGAIIIVKRDSRQADAVLAPN